MGLRNAPLTFQRMINSLFAGVVGKGLLLYLDDLIVVSKDLDSHVQQLSLIFQNLTQADLKVKFTKCEFLKSRIEFLGYLVDGDGIHTADSKVTAVKNFPTPKYVENVCFFSRPCWLLQSFCEELRFYCFSFNTSSQKDVPFQWNDAQQHSFTTLKDALTHAPILAFPDYTLPFTLCADAPALGIGVVLMQTEEGKRPHAIAYANRVLTSAESKYSVTHLEALAVVWALKHFGDIIFGYPVTVYTDHIAVTQIFQGKNLTGRLTRCFLTIQQFEPTLKYLPGGVNTCRQSFTQHSCRCPCANFQFLYFRASHGSTPRSVPVQSHLCLGIGRWLYLPSHASTPFSLHPEG